MIYDWIYGTEQIFKLACVSLTLSLGNTFNRTVFNVL